MKARHPNSLCSIVFLKIWNCIGKRSEHSCDVIIFYIGVGLHLEGRGLIYNNSIIRMSATGRFNKLQCISGSKIAGVGQWIAPNGNNITEDNTDLFNITVGDLDDPGFTSIELEDGASLAVEDEGVYTCIIPDENGDIHYLSVGLYGRGFNSKEHIHINLLIISLFSTALPQVRSLQLVIDSNSALALNCTSTGSPARIVVWRKDRSFLTNFSTYTASQILRDGLSSTYDNLLEIKAEPSELAGTYSCIIHDSLGHNSEPAIIQVKGIKLIENCSDINNIMIA